MERIFKHKSNIPPAPLTEIIYKINNALRRGYFVNEEKKFLIQEYLVDFLLILLLFKKNKPENLFFKSENDKEWLDFKEEYTAAVKEEIDRNELRAYVSSGDISGLVYSHHFYLDSKYNNYFLDCLEWLRENQTSTGPQFKALKDCVNSLYYNHNLKENIIIFAEKIISKTSREITFGASDRGQENFYTNLLCQLKTKSKKKDICIYPILFGEPENHNHNMHFIVSNEVVGTNHASTVNTAFIKARIYEKKIESVITYDEDFKNISPYWGTDNLSKDPVLILNPTVVLKNTNIKFDIVALTLFQNLTLSGHTTYPDEQKEKKIEKIFKQIESLKKLLKPDGKIVLFIHEPLPARYCKKLFAASNIFISVSNKLSVLVLEKNIKNKNVTFFNGREFLPVRRTQRENTVNLDFKTFYYNFLNEFKKEKSVFWKTIPINDWKKKNYTSQIKRYYLPKIKGTRLEEFVKINKRALVKNPKKAKFVGISNLSKTPSELNSNELQEQNTNLTSFPVIKIDYSCLLISFRGEELKPTKFNYTGTPIYIKGGVHALIVDEEKVSYEFLMYALDSLEIRDQLTYIAQGLTIPYYATEDIMNLRVVVPKSKTQQQKVINERKFNILERFKLKDLAESIRIDQYEKLRSLRHAMGDYLSNISSHLEIMLSKVEGYNDLSLNRNTNIEGLDLIRRLKALNKDFSSLQDLTSRFKQGLEFDSKHYPLTNTPLKEVVDLIEETVFQNRSKLFKSSVEIRLEGEKKAFNINDKKTDYKNLGWKINKKALKIFIQNFISNTAKHSGFKEPNTSNNEFKVLIELDDQSMVLSIMNNGRPFKEGFGKKEFITVGQTTDIKKGDGIGGNQIEAIANLFEVESWDIVSEENNPYTIQFKFFVTLEPL
jgi:hypothetical protein